MLTALNDKDVVAGCGKKRAKRGTEKRSPYAERLYIILFVFKKRAVSTPALFLLPKLRKY